MVAGAFLLPLGLISKVDDKKIDKRDSDIAGFLRSLGGIGQAIGATTTEAMGRLDFRSLGYLREDVTLLYNRLMAGIEPKLCWDRFVGETGSEQVDRSVRIFRDATILGGQPQAVGNSASAFAMQIALLRAKRQLIDSGIMWLTIVMHLVLSVLVVFVYQILLSFSGLLEQVMPGGDSGSMITAGLPSFGLLASDSMALQLLHFMIILVVIVLAFANATAVFATAGGHVFKLSYYLSFTLSISGAAITFVPSLVKTMFLSFA
jgi:flagellar protein FlaJ